MKEAQTSLKRSLSLLPLLEKGNYFLLGPRATGKTTLIRETLTQNTLRLDLLDAELHLKLLQRPSELLNIVHGSKQRFIVIDEIQRIPALLDQVHLLIEEKKHRFLLTGSSARKLKRGSANMLGGRARMSAIFPLVSAEIPQFDLHRYLNTGGLPSIYLSAEPWEDQKAYVETYLNEEVAAEGLVRSLPQFSRFLSIAALSSGQLMNFAMVGSDAQVHESTVRNYFQILEDTLLGVMLPPFTKTLKRKAIQTVKFYFFDVGISNVLSGVRQQVRKTPAYGAAFEAWVHQELRAYLSYRRRDETLSYWRSVNGQEVDFCIGSSIAVEVKAKEHIAERDLSGLKALKEENIFQKFIVVSLEPIASRTPDGIQILPWQDFVRQLWNDELI